MILTSKYNHLFESFAKEYKYILLNNIENTRIEGEVMNIIFNEVSEHHRTLRRFYLSNTKIYSRE